MRDVRSQFFGALGNFTVVALDADIDKVLGEREGEKRYEVARRSLEKTLGV